MSPIESLEPDPGGLCSGCPGFVIYLGLGKIRVVRYDRNSVLRKGHYGFRYDKIFAVFFVGQHANSPPIRGLLF